MVGAAMAEPELERLQAERLPEQLVTEADPEQRRRTDEIADDLDTR